MLLDGNDWNKLMQTAKNKYLLERDDIIQCFTAGCQQLSKIKVMFVRFKMFYIKCSLCEQSYCTECKVTIIIYRTIYTQAANAKINSLSSIWKIMEWENAPIPNAKYQYKDGLAVIKCIALAVASICALNASLKAWPTLQIKINVIAISQWFMEAFFDRTWQKWFFIYMIIISNFFEKNNIALSNYQRYLLMKK